MHAAVVEDGELRWREKPDPTPGTGELLVAVKASAVNNADLLQVRGGYPAPPGSPSDIPGLEFAGEVVDTGPDVFGYSGGERVMALTGGGGYAELAVVHERQAMPVPDGIGWSAAGGFPETFTTAHDALFGQARLRMGERVCVHGAAGGVGTSAVQLAAVAGARVSATVRNPDLHDAVRELGAEMVLAPSGFADAGPFDVVLELVGAPNWPANLDALAPWGRICVIGVGAGPKVELNLLSLMQTRGTIHASTLRARPLEEKATVAQTMTAEVVPLLAEGRLQVPICEEFSMADAQAAHERFAEGGKLGKIVLLAG